MKPIIKNMYILQKFNSSFESITGTGTLKTGTQKTETLATIATIKKDECVVATLKYQYLKIEN